MRGMSAVLRGCCINGATSMLPRVKEAPLFSASCTFPVNEILPHPVYNNQAKASKACPCGVSVIRRLFSLSAILLALTSLPLRAADPKTISEAIAHLADLDPARRDKATKTLWQMGRDA